MILDYILFSINIIFMKRYEVNIEENVVQTFSFEIPPGECQFRQMEIHNLDDDSWTEWKEF